jgi:hypothetical protein
MQVYLNNITHQACNVTVFSVAVMAVSDAAVRYIKRINTSHESKQKYLTYGTYAWASSNCVATLSVTTIICVNIVKCVIRMCPNMV